jgi:hypothetical protein
MFDQIIELDCIFEIPRNHNYDFAIVRGDASIDFQQAVAARIPYILIEHDVLSARKGLPSHPKEKVMIENAACVLFTSEHHRDMLTMYNVPEWRQVFLRPQLNDLQFNPLPKLRGKHLVYSGGITTPGCSEGFGYRRYDKEIFPTLMKAGWTVHVYPAWQGPERGWAYTDIGCVVHDVVPQNEIYRELSQYKVGFQGYAEEGHQFYLKHCVPNKVWEYLGAGIPTVGYNTGVGGKIYDGRWGLVASSLEELPKAARLASKMTISDELRYSEVMDNDMGVFEELVEIALSKKVKKAKPARPGYARRKGPLPIAPARLPADGKHLNSHLKMP